MKSVRLIQAMVRALLASEQIDSWYVKRKTLQIKSLVHSFLAKQEMVDMLSVLERFPHNILQSLRPWLKNATEKARTNNKQHSIVKVQKTYRGYKTRKSYDIKRHQHHQAAKTIQRRVRERQTYQQKIYEYKTYKKLIESVFKFYSCHDPSQLANFQKTSIHQLMNASSILLNNFFCELGENYGARPDFDLTIITKLKKKRQKRDVVRDLRQQNLPMKPNFETTATTTTVSGEGHRAVIFKHLEQLPLSEDTQNSEPQWLQSVSIEGMLLDSLAEFYEKYNAEKLSHLPNIVASVRKSYHKFQALQINLQATYGARALNPWDLIAAILTRFFEHFQENEVEQIPKLMALLKDGKSLRKVRKLLIKRYQRAPRFRQDPPLHLKIMKKHEEKKKSMSLERATMTAIHRPLKGTAADPSHKDNFLDDKWLEEDTVEGMVLDTLADFFAAHNPHRLVELPKLAMMVGRQHSKFLKLQYALKLEYNESPFDPWERIGLVLKHFYNHNAAHSVAKVADITESMKTGDFSIQRLQRMLKKTYGDAPRFRESPPRHQQIMDNYNDLAQFDDTNSTERTVTHHLVSTNSTPIYLKNGFSITYLEKVLGDFFSRVDENEILTVSAIVDLVAKDKVSLSQLALVLQNKYGEAPTFLDPTNQSASQIAGETPKVAIANANNEQDTHIYIRQNSDSILHGMSPNNFNEIESSLQAFYARVAPQNVSKIPVLIEFLKKGSITPTELKLTMQKKYGLMPDYVVDSMSTGIERKKKNQSAIAANNTSNMESSIPDISLADGDLSIVQKVKTIGNCDNGAHQLDRKTKHENDNFDLALKKMLQSGHRDKFKNDEHAEKQLDDLLGRLGKPTVYGRTTNIKRRGKLMRRRRRKKREAKIKTDR